MEINFSFNR